MSSTAGMGAGGYFEQHTPEEAHGQGYGTEVYGEEVGEVQWEKRFVKCSYAMVRLLLPRSSTLRSCDASGSVICPTVLGHERD